MFFFHSLGVSFFFSFCVCACVVFFLSIVLLLSALSCRSFAEQGVGDTHAVINETSYWFGAEACYRMCVLNNSGFFSCEFVKHYAHILIRPTTSNTLTHARRCESVCVHLYEIYSNR